MDDPTPIADADAVIVESTYGNRLHKSLATTYDELAQVLATTLPRGNVIIPAFAVGRTQEVLHVLADLVRQGRAPALNIFVDSPLATRATEITAKYAAILDRESRDLAGWVARNKDKVRVRFTETPQDSMAINSVTRGAVIVAASGMCEGGRIRHHLRHNLPREECAIVFTGFQAAGTLGRADRRRCHARASLSRRRAGARVGAHDRRPLRARRSGARSSRGCRRSARLRHARSSSTASARPPSALPS